MSGIGGLVFVAIIIVLLGGILALLTGALPGRRTEDPLGYKNADELADALLSRGPDSSRPMDTPPDDPADIDMEDVADEDAAPFGEDRHFNAITGQVEGPLLDDPGEELDDDELRTFDAMHGYDPDYFDEGDDYQPDLGIDDDSDPGERDWRQRR